MCFGNWVALEIKERLKLRDIYFNSQNQKQKHKSNGHQRKCKPFSQSLIIENLLKHHIPTRMSKEGSDWKPTKAKDGSVGKEASSFDSLVLLHDNAYF